jgi:hypothetical protein
MNETSPNEMANETVVEGVRTVNGSPVEEPSITTTDPTTKPAEPARDAVIVSLRLGRPALDALVERNFLAPGDAGDEAAIRRAVAAMLSAAYQDGVAAAVEEQQHERR